MIQFSKLRLHGFKSFCEKTELDVGPGLTGIVGTNGCGKSNLVEALRWSMGESSTKRMRGGSRSMDDMIFNGTAKRPARNTAEVSILLDNTFFPPLVSKPFIKFLLKRNLITGSEKIVKLQ